MLRMKRSFSREFLFMAKLKKRIGFLGASTGARLDVTSNLKPVQNLNWRMTASFGWKWILFIGKCFKNEIKFHTFSITNQFMNSSPSISCRNISFL